MTRSLVPLAAFVFVSLLACETEATKDASVPCSHTRECTTGLECLPMRNGLSGACLQPACSKRCNSDDDCKGLRQVTGNTTECFVCREVGDCPAAQVSSGDAGSVKACVDRCEKI